MADSVEKVFLGWRPKFSRTAEAFGVRRCEGPHRFTQKRPRTFVAALQSLATARMSKNQLSQDFRCSSIFDFCNNICQKQKFTPNSPYSLLRAIRPRGRSRHVAVLAQPVQGLMLTEAAQFEMADFKDRCRRSLPPTVRTACYTPSVHVGAAGTSPSWHNPYKD